jgi:hypothetical protein
MSNGWWTRLKSEYQVMMSSDEDTYQKVSRATRDSILSFFLILILTVVLVAFHAYPSSGPANILMNVLLLLICLLFPALVGVFSLRLRGGQGGRVVFLLLAFFYGVYLSLGYVGMLLNALLKTVFHVTSFTNSDIDAALLGLLCLCFALALWRRWPVLGDSRNEVARRKIIILFTLFSLVFIATGLFVR